MEGDSDGFSAANKDDDASLDQEAEVLDSKSGDAKFYRKKNI
jgi:hypothetical protein